MNKKEANAPWIDKHGQEWLSRSLLAQRLGVTPAALYHGEKQEWISGKIKHGVKMFPCPQSEESYRQNSPTLQRRAEEAAQEEGEDEPTPAYSGRGRPAGNLQSATTTKVKLAAELLRLEYEAKLGKLVPMDEVKRVWEGAAETVKKAMLSIPDRIAPEFGGKNSHPLYRALVNEITHALASLKIEHRYEYKGVQRGGRRLGR